jgi:hypothetical protein
MNASQLIKMLQTLPPDTKIFGWIDGETIMPHETEGLDYCAESKDVHLNFINSNAYAAN